MSNRSLPVLFTCVFIFSISCSFAQLNTGIQAEGGAPVVKTVSEVIAAQYETRTIPQVSLEHLSAGLYILQIMGADLNLLKSFKIVKE